MLKLGARNISGEAGAFGAQQILNLATVLVIEKWCTPYGTLYGAKDEWKMRTDSMEQKVNGR